MRNLRYITMYRECKSLFSKGIKYHKNDMHTKYYLVKNSLNIYIGSRSRQYFKRANERSNAIHRETVDSII